MSDTFQREVAAFWTPETGRIWLGTDNSTGSVEFDWDIIWPAIRDAKPRPSMAVMFHTHPHGVTGMSSTDKNMVCGWATALGIPIWFTIYCDGLLHDYLCTGVGGAFRIFDLGTREAVVFYDEEMMSLIRSAVALSYDKDADVKDWQWWLDE